MDDDFLPVRTPVKIYSMGSGRIPDDQSEKTGEDDIMGRVPPFGSLSPLEESKAGSRKSNPVHGSSSHIGG